MGGMILELFFAALIVFIIFVGCPWVFLHYRTLQKKTGDYSIADYHRLQELNEIADNLTQRVQTLEAILDDEAPNWREKHHG